MIGKQDIIDKAIDYLNNSKDNYIQKDIALSEDLIGLKIFDEPIFSFGSAEDEGFSKLKEPEVNLKNIMLPEQWLTGAKTVISFFLPFTREVRQSNTLIYKLPSSAWLHGRIEGQAMLDKLCAYLKSWLSDRGYPSLAPSIDERFIKNNVIFTSNWSERHAAYICGLGTFSLSKGIITPNGMAGRLGSVITTLELEADEREYNDIYDYCTMCGSCIAKCPVNAISLEKGKDNKICSDFLEFTEAKYRPRFGCGKCQVGVPCESIIPGKRKG